MAKKNKELSSTPVEVVTTNALKDANLSSAPVAPQKIQNSKKKDNDKANKKPNIFKKLGRVFKEMFSEMKKVTWLTSKETFKRLGIVLVIVLIFLLLVMGFDALCNLLLELLIPGKSA
ncbi:MAG: preprotein translocase subunit SecE [Clostridia bacterium]